MDGTCTCKASVEGDKCTVCKDGFFNLARDGCEPCVCSSATTSSLLCNKETGQCGCKRGFYGGDCEQVLPSFYVPGLEGIIYEGEDAQLMGPKPVSPIDSSMLSGSACAQFEAVGDKATIRLQVPLQTIRYRLRMRYSADANTGNIDFDVTRLGNSNYSCASISISGQNLFENHFTLTSTAADDIDVAPDLCLEANDTVILTVTQAGAPSDWCLDAALLMPLQSEFGSDVTNNDIFGFPGCYIDRLTELGPPSNPTCEPFAVRASGWLFGGAFECNCDSVGASNSYPCDPLSGECVCADSVIGRTCSACGYNSFNVTSSGCQACDCVEAGTNPSRPCDSTTGECLCKNNFTGGRCHLCKSGFKREVVNGNESIPCVPCECNGHSFDCHPITGVCMNCSNNTVGNFCEECEDGFFGDASSGGSCQACMCYHPVGSNGIVCDKVSGNCGCRDGYFNLTLNGCSACACSSVGTGGNLTCDKVTGQCDCVHGVTGVTCDRCQKGFYGYGRFSGIACRKCFCNEHADGCSLREIPTSAITSTFDVDNEGWTTIFDFSNGEVRHPAGSNRQGFLFFAAPPKYLGNQLASYGQLFTLDLGRKGFRIFISLFSK
ncbi:laminin subunit beta-2-like isoform X2 [Oscarella lobularis]|uniref:laminin subunit beta-2-like isoform X2 n=1 Tax=Oscarella lobularis TaxID=121494 RepID=UPI0033135FD8